MPSQVSKGGVGHALRAANRAAVPVSRHTGAVPPQRSRTKQHPNLRAIATPRRNAVAWAQNNGLIGKADPATWPAEKLARRKKEQAALGTTTALIGLGALTSKAGKGALIRIKPNARTAKVAAHLDQVTNHALIAGAGIGGVGGLNSASISRQEAHRVKKGLAMGVSAFGVEHDVEINDEISDEISKERGRYAARRTARSAALSRPASAVSSVAKVPPTGVAGSARRIAGSAVRGLTSPKGRLIGLAAGGAAAGTGVAALVHRRRSSVGKSAFGVTHSDEPDELAKAGNPMKLLGSARTASADVSRAFGRGAATATAKAPIRARAMSAGLAATSNPAQKAAFHTGNATRNFGAGFSRKPPSPAARAAGTHVTTATSTKPGAFKAGKLTRQYAVPAAVVGTGAYAGTSLANKKNRAQFGKSAFDVSPFGVSPFGVVIKSYGYDSEADRHRRAGITAGALGAGAAGLATASAGQARAAVRTGQQAQKAFKVASKGRDAANVRAGAKTAGKLVRRTTVHGGRAAALAGGAAGLAATAGAVIHHNRNAGRTQNGWYA